MRLPRLPQTVRGRLTAALAIVFTLALAAAALITVLVVRHVLVNRLDDQLRAAGDRFSVALEHDDHDSDNRYGDVEGQLAGTLGARVLHGTVTNAAIIGGHHGNDDDVPAAARAQLARLTVDSTPHSVRLADVGLYRVVVAKGRDGDVQITGLPERPIENTIDKLALVVIVVFAIALLAIVLVAAGLLRVMLAPLSRISTTAAEVADLPLDTGGVSLPHRVDAGAGGSEVDTLARAFNAMLEQVESALRTRADSEDRLRRFIADASHELRTPIAVVRGHAELAQREGGPDLVPDVSRSLGRIAAQSERMSHLVEDLLLLARLDSGRPLAAEPVDLVRTVLDAVDDARIAAPTHRWRLALPDGAIDVIGDAHALAQVVSNLLSNAAAHTPEGTTVSVSLSS
ncbi:sensor histidine kinase [uncultured Jatrophihabitans sp.]|uniref:sensor histidine kinase n=1 Tax=uncultured Jatrophihabitans sp. TaxID=1610747 RepID=UPI0035C9AE11